PVTVTFHKPASDRAPEPLLQLYPETKGAYAWLSPRTLLFQPDFPGLLRGSMYTVHVPARPEAGVPQPVTRKFTVTGKLTVQQVIPGDGDTEVPLGAQVFVQFSRSVAPLTTLAVFNQPMDPAAADGLSVRDAQTGAPVRGKLTWNADRTTLTFNPAARMAASTKYLITVDKGQRGARGGATARERTASFTTVG